MGHEYLYHPGHPSLHALRRAYPVQTGVPISLAAFKEKTNCGENPGITYKIEAEDEDAARAAAAMHYQMDDPSWHGRLSEETTYPYCALMIIHGNAWTIITPSA